MKLRISARRSGLLVGMAVYAAVLGGCGDSSAPLVPATIQVVAGNQQTAAAGAAVPVAPSVKVLASNGAAVKGVAVTFTPAAESGTVVGGSQVTDANGVATVTSWTLGTKAGTSTLNVAVAGLAPMPITATTAPGAAASIKLLTGDGQNALVGATLPVQPSVRVADSYDNGVPDVAVTFTLPNGGSVERAAVQTDANGVASAGVWRLATTAGLQQVIATAAAPGLTSSPVTFTSTAVAEAASVIAIITQPSTTNASGMRLTVQPVVEFRDRFNNPAAFSGARTVTASLASGTGTLSGTTSVTTQTGRIAFTDLTYTGTGTIQLRFTSSGFPDVTSNAFTVAAAPQCPGSAVSLDYTLGQMTRFVTSANDVPRCLDFSAARNAGQQYLVMFENLSARGGYASALFPGAQTDEGTFSVTVQASGTAGSPVSAPASSSIVASAPADAVEGWSFGDKDAFEIQPKSEGRPALIKRNGQWLSVNGSEAATPVVGDTLMVQLEGITRLNIASGQRAALVRYVDSNIIIAEDVRFYGADTLTFRRTNGSRNTPIADADLQQIASEYARYSLVQATTFFDGRYNTATELNPGRPIAVHTMMYADNIWGYTYSVYNYFAFDYWVNSADGRTKDVYQNAQRDADDLFMHEIAHMRHYGMLERTARTNVRGNQWLVEGFARFTERLPIAARLLGTQSPARTGNVTLPLNPALISNGRQVFFYDDVPTYLNVGASMYAGYGASSFVFDYFADQVAQSGGNWLAAVRDLLLKAGVQSDVDAVANQYLGIDFGTLFTRARIALYTDDYGTPGLPAWTQYLQYNLRASRYGSTASATDARATWPKITPGVSFAQVKSVDAGAAFGYLIDGTLGVSDAHITIDPSRVPNGVMAIVRIK